jgi:hypothetical protein
LRAAAHAFLLAALLVAGCAGGGEQQIDAGALPRLVLQPADLEGEYRRFDEGRLVRADEPRGSAGWKARYRWEGPAEAAVPLVVESRVDLFEGTEAAKDALRGARGLLEGDSKEAAGLGDEGALTTFTREAEPVDVRFLVAVWRDRNVVVTLTLNGFDGTMSEDDLLALARKQASRLAGA